LPFTFGLREFARLAATVDVASLPPAPVAREHALVEQARSRRGLLPPAVPEVDRVPDPVGRPVEVHREAASWMNVAIKAIVHFIAPPGRFAP
jgi:protein-tyrosine phosphatase